MEAQMKKTVCVALAAMALILTSTISGHAAPNVGGGGHGSVRSAGGGWHGGGWHGGGWYGGGWHGGGWYGGVWYDPGWWPGWWGYPYYPYYYPYPYYPFYVTPPASAPPQSYEYVQPEEQHYWYFCQDPKGYYPYVNKCPKGWLKVVPSPTPNDGEE
jgi:hypothetical protein